MKNTPSIAYWTILLSKLEKMPLLDVIERVAKALAIDHRIEGISIVILTQRYAQLFLEECLIIMVINNNQLTFDDKIVNEAISHWEVCFSRIPCRFSPIHNYQLHEEEKNALKRVNALILSGGVKGLGFDELEKTLADELFEAKLPYAPVSHFPEPQINPSITSAVSQYPFESFLDMNENIRKE